MGHHENSPLTTVFCVSIMRPLLFLLVSIPLAFSSGYLQLTLESEIAQTVTVRLISDPIYHGFERNLVPGNQEVFMHNDLDFQRRYTLLIDSNESERSLLNFTDFPVYYGSLKFPIDSLKLAEIKIRCDDLWYGEKCEKNVDGSQPIRAQTGTTSSDRVEDVTIPSDYSGTVTIGTIKVSAKAGDFWYQYL